MPRRGLPPSRVDPDITGLASVLADPSRIAMLDALLDAQPHTIGDLARRAAITAATASTHVRRLAEARLVTVTAAGRERRVQLASGDVAELLERLAVLAAPAPAPAPAPTRTPTPSPLTPAAFDSPARSRAAQLRFARTCYDHLAGVLGVAITTALLARGWVHRTSDNFEPAPALFAWLTDHGHDVPVAGRRPLTRACLDWSERVPHVAGRIGLALADVCLAERWVTRLRGTRALRLTDRGHTALTAELGVQLPHSARI